MACAASMLLLKSPEGIPSLCNNNSVTIVTLHFCPIEQTKSQCRELRQGQHWQPQVSCSGPGHTLPGLMSGAGEFFSGCVVVRTPQRLGFTSWPLIQRICRSFSQVKGIISAQIPHSPSQRKKTREQGRVPLTLNRASSPRIINTHRLPNLTLNIFQ